MFPSTISLKKLTRTLTKNKSSATTKSKSKINSSAAEIFPKLKEAFKKPENYFHFTLGVLAEFFPPIKITYASVKTVASQFIPCFREFSEAREAVPSIPQFESFESELKNPAQKLEYCGKIKRDIIIFHLRAHMESSRTKFNLLRDIFHVDAAVTERLTAMTRVGTGFFKTKDTYCTETITENAPSVHEIIVQNYKSLSNFKAECLYFHGLDCDVFNPLSAGMTDFAKQAYKFYGSLKKAGTCIGATLSDPNNTVVKDAKSKLLQYFTGSDFIGNAMGAVAGLVANVMTFGIWGGLKGAYYLVKLGKQISEFWPYWHVDTAFKIGEIVGKAIMIVKAILFGRRRFLKKK